MADTGLEFLREIDLFRDLTIEELAHIHDLAVEHQYQRGDFIFMQGEEREAVFFIGRGLVKILKEDDEGREHIVNILGKGQMFPHVGFFQDSPYPGTAQAIEATTVLAVRRVQFDAVLMKYPEIARKLMNVMGKKILQLQAKLQELALFDSRERVMALLGHFAEEYGQVQSDGVHVKLQLTHGDMAHMIGMTRESVNRVWNQLRKEGVLSGERDDWVLHVNEIKP